MSKGLKPQAHAFDLDSVFFFKLIFGLITNIERASALHYKFGCFAALGKVSSSVRKEEELPSV